MFWFTDAWTFKSCPGDMVVCLPSNIAVYQDYNITVKNNYEFDLDYMYSTAEHPRLKRAQYDTTPRRGTSYDKRCA